jgi:phage anti-repressor protein
MLHIIDDIKLGQTTESDNLYEEIGLASNQYKRWCENTLIKYGVQNTDYYLFNDLLQSTAGRNKKTIIYRLTVNFSKELCMIARTEKAKKLRQYLIELSQQHETGILFSTPQIEALMDLSKAMTLISIQKEVEKKHFNIYNDKYSWYQYRAALLGYSTESVIEAMKKINRQHHSIRKSLIQLDSNELIRTGVIDFMIAMGKTQEYATNVGNLCKSLSEKAKFGNIIWDDTKDNPLQINLGEVSDRKILLDNSIKQLK